MTTRETYTGGVLRERWDDTSRTLTTWSATGTLTGTRAYTPAEAAEADERVMVRTSTTNGAALLAKAATALTNNAAFLAVASPTNAQAVAQVKALTRQVNALIRLARRDLLSTDGT
ncbi:MAG: hypothetical protein IPG16_02355 [Comamonadaceae bacterium]|nr:hypothetical protein [Comamonadaceae bacterium]